MSESFSESVRHFFAEAKRMPEADRMTWLDNHCPDEAVRHQVFDLLKFDREDHFLEAPLNLMGVSAQNIADEFLGNPMLSSVDASSTTLSWKAEEFRAEGTLISDRYRLLQSIGEGGFGVVYMAEQIHPVRRRVAVKLLKPGMDSQSILARFEAERQALALMDHPSIAKIYDGGLARDGRPYFVMELVGGVSLTSYCREHDLSVRAKISLLRDVCLAIQHAHQKGIIHRDIKPSNILVHDLDGRAVPKVIDFGIAKALHGPLTDRTIFTEFRQMIGTLEYMSPEQALTSTVDVDTRSDVYALGVLAYELLTGTTPLDGKTLRQLGWFEIQKTIQETESPTPSTRLASLRDRQETCVDRPSPSKFTSSVNARAFLEPDLDWIVMKAIDKDRQRRYSTALELADELQRWLQGDPILARPPSWKYRAEKWIRKHRMRATVGTILGFAFLGGVGGIGYGIAQRMTAAEQKAASEFRTEQSKKMAELEKERFESLAYANAMIAAGESFQMGRRSVTRQLLASIPAEKRGPEWNWLNQMSSDHSMLLPAKSQGATSSICFMPHTTELVSVGEDGMIRIWDTLSGQNTRHWKAGDFALTQVEVSHRTSEVNAADIYSGDSEGVLRRWDEMGRLLAERPFLGTISCLALIRDDQVLGVGTETGDVCFLDSQTLEPRLTIDNSQPRYRGKVHSILFALELKQYVVAGKGGVRGIDESSGDVVTEYGNFWQNYGVAQIGGRDTFAAYGPPISLLSLRNRDSIREFSLPSSGIAAAASFPNQDKLLFVTDDQALRSLDTSTGKQETLAYGDHDRTLDLAVSANGQEIAACGEDGSIRLWKQADFAMTTFVGAESPIAQLGIDSNKNLVGISTEGKVHGWSASTGELNWSEGAFEQQGFSISTSSNSDFVVAAGLPEFLWIWKAARDQPPVKLPMSWGARFAQMHPNGFWMAGPMSKDPTLYELDETNAASTGTLDVEGQIALWDLPKRKVIRVFSGFTNWSLGLAFNRDGKKLAAASVDGSVAIWNVESGSMIAHLQGAIAEDNTLTPKQVCFHTDGKTVFIGTGDGQVLVWDSQANKILRRIVAYGDEISRLVFVEDGQRLVTASNGDSRIRVWDWRIGQKMWELDSGMPGVFDMLLDDDLATLYLSGADHQVRAFRIAPTN